MQAEEAINNLPELLEPYLGSSKKIVDTKITRLTAPGENFGSIMLKVDFILRDENGEEDQLHAVAKKLPATELFREVFNIQVTYKNEVAFYDTIIPTLKKFEEEEQVQDRLNCFANLYGARLSLNNNSDKVEEDAVLVLENLIVKGYGNIDRLVGFDLETAEFIINDIAKFHGTSLALKLKEPEVFEKKVKATCHDYIPKSEFGVICLEAMKDILMENPECHHLIPKVSLWGHRPIPKPREPFATLTHCDLWVNNMLQKFDNNGKVVGNKLVDFQVYSYRSVVSDLFFFLWSSVQQPVLETHLDHLLKFYHDKLIQTLEKFHCDTRPFSYETFLKELEIESNFEFGHALQFLTFVVNGKKGGSQISEVPDKYFFLKSVTPKVKQQVWYMVLECARRGWLY